MVVQALPGQRHFRCESERHIKTLALCIYIRALVYPTVSPTILLKCGVRLPVQGLSAELDIGFSEAQALQNIERNN